MRRKGTLKLEDTPRHEALVKALEKAKASYRRGKYPLRNLALVATLTFTGCRLGEALALWVSDLDFKARTVRIKQLKKRGEFTRIVPVVHPLYWEIMGEYVKGLPYNDSPLFPISVRHARRVVYAFTLKYLGRRVRSHAFRHSYALFILKTTRDLEAVRRLLGHSGYKWLKAYLDYSQEDLAVRLEEAYRRLETLGYGAGW